MKIIAKLTPVHEPDKVFAAVLYDDLQTGEYRLQSTDSAQGWWYPTLLALKADLSNNPLTAEVYAADGIGITEFEH